MSPFIDVSLSHATLCESLQQRGWAVCDDFISPALVTALNNDLSQLQRKQILASAGVGRAEDYQRDHRVRRDKIVWLDGHTLAQCQLLAVVEQLRLVVNQQLFLGLFEFEGHYAVYPPGGFYQKHRDSFHGEGNRVLSFVVYLNQNWLPGDGGELVLYQIQDPVPVECILPLAGRAVIFLSEEIPHEVLKTLVERRSIAGWFRINTSGPSKVDPAR